MGVKAMSIDTFSNNSVCRIVSQNLREARIKLRLLSINEQSADLQDPYSASIQKLAADQNSLFEVVKDNKSADWLFALLTPSAVKRYFGEITSAPVGFLLPSNSALALLAPPDGETPRANSLASIPNARYSAKLLENSDAFASTLVEDLRKIQVWENFWQVAGAYSETSPLVTNQEIFLEFTKVSGPNDDTSGKPFDGSQIARGDYVDLRVVNTSYEPYWYTVFFLDGRYGIHQVAHDAIRGCDNREHNETRVVRKVNRLLVNENMLGTNGIIVVAVRQQEHPIRPDYRFLVQLPLDEPGSRASINTHIKQTPFQKLMQNSLGGTRERFRSSISPDEPQVSAWSWVTK